jgi:hypothetical protein
MLDVGCWMLDVRIFFIRKLNVERLPNHTSARRPMHRSKNGVMNPTSSNAR